MAANFAALDRYIDRQIEAVAGYFGHVEWAAIDAIGRWQVEQGIKGNLAEIGVHHGKLYFILALLRQAGERALAIDLFKDDGLNTGIHAGRDRAFFDNRARLGIDLDEGEVWTVDTLTLTPEALRTRIGAVRLFSVDGGHAYKNVVHDMRLAEAVLADDGVMIVHDFFGIGWPDVSVAAIHLLTDMKDRLQPFLITQYKLFVARPEAAERYRKMLATNPRLASAQMSERTMFDRPITLFNLGRRELLERRIKRKLGFYPKKL
ncbi:class I SAM-dependent methyltransferase [Sphingopyxis sp. KK2]|uniref:class I SAM-dependent methyltransferase n=1 Tax=Sphingopyxis sp. KK2 TaxID=1855727 RepID=UPI00097E5F36|nr:class I SAM-dependent methyltransferase [Sphingopyxis sp. KK2]